MAIETAPDVTTARPDLIFQTATGFMASKHLFAANELGVFEVLGDGPLSLEDLADRLQIPTRTARISADALVALGFLQKEGSRYGNAAVSQSFLSGKGSLDLRPFLRFWNQISYPHWQRLEESLRTNERIRGELTPEQEEIFSRGVAAFTAGPARGLAKGTTLPATGRFWTSVGAPGRSSSRSSSAVRASRRRFSSCPRSPRSRASRWPRTRSARASRSSRATSSSSRFPPGTTR